MKCLPIHDADALTRGEIDRLESFVKKELGAKGLAWVRVTADGSWQSPIAQVPVGGGARGDRRRTGARPGSLLFFAADEFAKANAILGRLRTDLGRQLGRVDERAWALLFVVDFPVFERDEHGKLTFIHMPFVAPVEEDLALFDTEPERMRGTHYDVVHERRRARLGQPAQPSQRRAAQDLRDCWATRRARWRRASASC